MATTCEIQLERDDAVYYSGEEIKGTIILRTQKDIKVNAIFFTVAGEAISDWEEGGKHSKYYHDRQQILYHREKIVDSTNILVGQHVYNISMLLPNDCPSTCKGLYGHISYKISIKLERPLKFDKVFRKDIVIYQPLDLNEYPEYMLPNTDENIKFFCVWPCRSGPTLSSLEIPVSGYIPGQYLPFLINIDNQSQNDIVGIEASLRQKFIFWAHKPTYRQNFTKTLAKVIMNESTLGLSKRTYAASLAVPPNTQRTTLHENCVVSLCYEFKVKLKTCRLHNDIVMRIPIVIGTVPLLKHRNSMQISNNIGELTCHPSYANCLPPSSLTVSNTSSQQNIDESQHQINRPLSFYENLPQFPGNDTFASRTLTENCVYYAD